MERRFLYATIQKMGKTYQSQRQITGFSFLGWFAAPAVSCYDYTVEPKGNCNNGLGIGYPDFLKIPINKNIRPTIFDDNWSFLI